MKRKSLISLILIFTMILSVCFIASPVFAFEGPNYNGNETINNSRITTHEEMSEQLYKYAKKSNLLEVEVIGHSVKGREISLVKFGKYDETKPTVLFMTQQHGNEVLSTEAALEVIKKLSSNDKKVQELADNINVFFIPMYNPDGGSGDVNFDISHYVGGGLATRENANRADLNRDHVAKAQPETQALHYHVLQKYKIDYMIDFHHQGTQSAVDNEYVTGSILYPTNKAVADEVVLASKQLGAVLYNAVSEKGWGHVGRYNGTTAETMVRNGIPMEYGTAALLFEMRGMIDHSYTPYVLGQKSNGYLIQQSVVSMEAVIGAIADRSIRNADISFWDTLPIQRNKITE